MVVDRQFIEDFVKMTKLLTDLIDKKIPETISWTKDLQTAFDLLKDRVRSTVVL